VLKAWAAHVHHRLAACRQPLGQVSTEATSILHRPTTLGESFRPTFEGPQTGAVVREGSALNKLADDFVHSREGDGRLVGIDPDQHLHARTCVPLGPATGVCEGHSDFEPCIPLLSHFARRGRQRDASLEQANPSLMGGRTFASDPYWRPRSLQQLQTAWLLTGVKQVGRWVNRRS
jgi:hypothetical protein